MADRVTPGRVPRSRWRFALTALVALAAALSPTTASPVHAAEELRVEADGTYRIDTSDGVVRVRMDVTATNLKANTTRATPTGSVTTRYFYDRLFFPIQLDARSVRVTSGGSTLASSLSTKRSYRELTVRMPDLYFRQARTLRIEYDLRGGKPRSTSDIRVGAAFATFTAWAWGDAGRSTVRVVMPAGFTNDGYGAELTSRQEDGGTVLTSGTIADPTEWYSVVIADRPAGLTNVRVGPAAEPIVIRAWPEDTAWRDEVSQVLVEGVPILKDLIGMDWPVVDELTVTEVHTPLLEGYAGIYDSTADEIRISEDLDAQTILHEASHAWFDHGFMDERWVIEGLAEEYASRVRAELDLEGEDGPPTLDRTAPEAFPLADWPPLGGIDDDASFAREQYGYDASWSVMRQVATEVGDEGMREVFDAIVNRTIGYVGDAPAETTGVRSDWRRFLDLIQEIGGADEADDLFLAWVAPPSASAALAERETAREAYVALDAAADEWAVPYVVRSQMWSWSFEEATDGMAAATSVVERRTDLDKVSEQLGATSPDDLETRFESATRSSDLAGIGSDLDERIDTAEELIRTRDILALERTPLVALGLVGEIPNTGLDDGVAAFVVGDLEAAKAGAARSMALLASAESIGGTRALVIGAVVIGLLVLLVAVAIMLGRRRNGAARVRTMGADGGASTTLAATPDPANMPTAESAPTSPSAAGDEPD